MTKIRGELKKSDLEGGLLIFQGEDGESYQLEGLPANLQSEGRLEVEGKIQKDVATIGMTGPVFVVTGAQKI
jgi:hypothetical protein